MADIRSQDVIDMFINRINNPANSGISWGVLSGGQGVRYPPDYQGRMAATYRSFFTGSVYGGSEIPANSEFTGDLDNDYLRQRMLYCASRYTAIRRVHVYVTYRNTRHLNRPWFAQRAPIENRNVVINQTALGHLGSEYLYTPTDPNVANNTPDPSGTNADYTLTDNWFRTVYQFITNTRNATITLRRDLCHTSCHSNCHWACHGDSPGTGDGSDR